MSYRNKNESFNGLLLKHKVSHITEQLTVRDPTVNLDNGWLAVPRGQFAMIFYGHVQWTTGHVKESFTMTSHTVKSTDCKQMLILAQQ